MRKILPIIFITISNYLFCQSINTERILKLKSSVVRILVDDKPSGSGFFISQDGWIATCWHVIEKAIFTNTQNNKINLKKITVEFNNGEQVEAEIMLSLLNKDYLTAKVFDFCQLKIKSKPKTNFSYLKLGKFNNINEGEQIYTCGYPLGIKQQLITTGILSTKWIDTVTISRLNFPDSLIFRNVSWLDLTMNKGNSGGPIVKLGNSIENDEVIGISTFILNPFAQSSELLLEYLSKIPEGSGAFFSGISFTEVIKLFGNAIANNSVGVSGCISIDHLINMK